MMVDRSPRSPAYRVRPGASVPSTPPLLAIRKSPYSRPFPSPADTPSAYSALTDLPAHNFNETGSTLRRRVSGDTTPRARSRSKSRGSSAGRRSLGTSSTPGTPRLSPALAPPVSADHRGTYRLKLQEALEHYKAEDATKQQIYDLMSLQRGEKIDDKAFVDQLKRLRVTAKILGATQVGKLVAQFRTDETEALVAKWKMEVKTVAAVAVEIENSVYRRVFEPSSPHTPQTPGTAERLAQRKYGNEIRNILQILKREHNSDVRRGLLGGKVTVAKFVRDCTDNADIFLSPEMRMAQTEAMKSHDGFKLEANIREQFPFFDRTRSCPSCLDKSHGARYRVISNHAGFGETYFQNDVSRCVECKCNVCGHQWTYEE